MFKLARACFCALAGLLFASAIDVSVTAFGEESAVEKPGAQSDRPKPRDAKPFKVISTNHTGFTVSNLDRSVAFFRDGLGFELVSRAPRNPDVVSRITGVPGVQLTIAYLRGPGHTIELIEYSAPADRVKVVARPCDTGHAHLAFNVDDVDAAVAAAEKFGVKPVAPPVAIDQGPNRGRKVVYLRDADGITIEFIGSPAGS
jgi:catechol 2,3-dioxygenase-like lactoylglutathione lyase family enzyme